MGVLGRIVSAGLGISAALSLTVGMARADEAIRILCPTWPGYAPIFVANDLGYFKELGITVTMNFDDDRSDVLAAMARGDIEIDMRTVGEHQGGRATPTRPGSSSAPSTSRSAATASSSTTRSSRSPT